MKITRHTTGLLIVVLSISACGKVATLEPSRPAPTVTLGTPTITVPTPAPAPTIEPNIPVPGGMLVIGTTQSALPGLVSEGLVMTNAAGGYEPALVTEMPSVSADGLTVTYMLRQGIKFSDGSDENDEIFLDLILAA